MRRTWRYSQELPVDYPVVLRLNPLRHKAMAEQPSFAFHQSPTIVDRPQRRQFISREAGAHADLGIVTADIIAAAEPQQRRCTKREVNAPRLTRQKETGLMGRVPQEPSQIVLHEMVQE